jgi:hypothetical protein
MRAIFESGQKYKNKLAKERAVAKQSWEDIMSSI